MSDWQPIETAPRDGRGLLLIVPENPGDPVSESDIWLGFWEYKWEGFPGGEPTHWMPLPSPPSE